MCRKKRRLYWRAKKTQKPEHREAFKLAQNETRNALKKSHWSYVNGICLMASRMVTLNPSTDTLNLNSKIITVYLHFVNMDSFTLTLFLRHAS